jgi:hypothetical protein
VTFKPYVVSVDFNFEGQKNKYLDKMIELGGYRDATGRLSSVDAHKPYDFKCSFPGVKVDDIVVVKCATGLQVVKVVKVSHPHTIPAHATARVIAKLDLEGIARHESTAKAYEDLLEDINAAAQRAAEKKHFKKLAKLSPELKHLIETKELLEGGGIRYDKAFKFEDGE